MSNETLCGLIEAIASQQDRNAFTELFHYFAPRFKAYALGIGCGNAAAEGVAQDAMITVWRRAPTFNRKTGAASAWMFAILRDRRLDLVRGEHLVRGENGSPVEHCGSEHQPANSIDAGETHKAGKPREDGRSPWKGWPKEQLEVIHKAFFEGKSQTAIAEELRLPPETVTSRIRHALTRLQRFPMETRL